MTARHVDHLLIGGGVAAVTCAETLSQADPGGSVLLVSREPEPPYHRPPVSKSYLTGREARSGTHLHAADWYADAGVELLTRTSVISLDPAQKVAKLSDRSEISYGTALLATGAMVRRLLVEGAQLAGVHYLRALGNADAVRADAESAADVVCVGGSYVGCEVAASLGQTGRRCTIVMLEDEPMARGFGSTVGRHVRALLESHGVTVIGDAEVSHFTGEERIRKVVLKDGRHIPADVVVCGTGAVPDVALAKKAGLTIGPLGGVLCDARLWACHDGLYAAGDVCEYASTIHSATARIEHERVAQAQGAVAARNMLGGREEFRQVPSFWTDLADWGTLEYVGLGGTWDEEIVRGDPNGQAFSVFYRSGGRLVGALTSAGHADLKQASTIIAAGTVASDREINLAVA